MLALVADVIVVAANAGPANIAEIADTKINFFMIVFLKFNRKVNL